ncbi:hypothetical protein Heshes_10970 [Alicyclobacillus hesperidum]|uniref:1,4-beta-xylanase n=1 Tax=Alicyclobacillus hesperidum TaxID=89784 RepID=A0A1H2S0G8_9BACL|nr:hypothetical protein Heshes_10970 [Alicyclobacillus hesperidum]SDW24564.1 hypothetical protein SAMN04489725_103196 [Alicyclobacillus hesperidum]
MNGGAKLEFIRGITWGWVGIRGTWMTDEAKRSLIKLKETGANWVTLAFQALQDTPQSVEVNYWDEPVVTDEEVSFAIEYAHHLGLKVCLKPVVNCRNGTWRAHISFFDHDVPGEPTWSEWFQSYGTFIIHYAELAERLGCEMFCVGCEMVQADKRELEWRTLIGQVREVYHGTLTYNCDKYQEEYVRWWDAVDMVSSSGYYPVSSFPERVKELRTFAQQVNKPFFFMEVGCMNVEGAAERPNDWSHKGALSMQEQVMFYERLFSLLDNEPWFYGYMLWDWPATLYADDEAAYNRNYWFYHKPAEHVIRRYYARPQFRNV